MRLLVKLDVNGHTREVGIRPYDTLLDTLRHELNLTGTKRGCDMGTCGCCTVIVDGRPILGCLTLAADCEGKTVETIEAVKGEEELHPLQKAFEACGATQCGYCTPGFIMTAKVLLAENTSPSRDDIAYAISGNMCRCTGYVKILDAIEMAAAEIGTDAQRRKATDRDAEEGPPPKKAATGSR
jgi:carbon-monoxide dehydrogenase small subunit